MDNETLTLQFGQIPPTLSFGVPKDRDAITISALQPHPDVRGPADHVPDAAIIGTKVVLQFATVESLDVLISAAVHLRKQMVVRQNQWCVYTMLAGGLNASAAVGNGHLDLKLLAAHSASPAPERPEATPGRGALKDKTDQELDAEIAYWENEIKSAISGGAGFAAAGAFWGAARNEKYRRGLERAQHEAGVFGGLDPANYRKSEVQWHWGRE